MKLVHLRPSKNNVRPVSWMEELQSRRERMNVSLDANIMDTSQLSPTPYYNNAILEDIALTMHHQILQRALLPFETARHGLILFKIFLRQHALMSSSDGFDAHLLALLIAYLVQSKRISASFTPEAVFQAAITFLLNLDFQTQIMDFTSSSLTVSIGGEKSSFEQSFPLTLQHPLGSITYNCLWRVSSHYFEQFCRVANIAKNRLSMSSTKSTTAMVLTGVFESLFLKGSNSGVAGGYDLCLHVPLPSSLATAVEARFLCLQDSVDENEEEEVKEVQASLLHIPQPLVIAHRIKKLLTQALGNRATIIDTHLHTDTVVIGINFNHDQQITLRKVDRGPTHTQTTATKSFQRFWGDKSSLRRFKDGSIVEAVVWDDENDENDEKIEFTSKRQQLIIQITKYILTRHLPYLREKSDFLLSSFGDWSPHTIIQQFFPLSQGANTQNEEQAEVQDVVIAKLYEQSFITVQSLSKAWDELRSLLLTKLPHDTLPLRIEGVMTHSAMLRQTSLSVATPQLILQIGRNSDTQKAQNNPDTQTAHPNTQSTQNMLRAHHGEHMTTLTQTMDIWVRLESATGRWPVGKDAIEACKSAMLIRLQQVLKKNFQVSTMTNCFPSNTYPVHPVDQVCSQSRQQHYK